MRQRKQIKDVIATLGICWNENEDIGEDACCKCCYFMDGPMAEECVGWLHSDAKYYLESLSKENNILRNEPLIDQSDYWFNICEINRRQEAKGKKKYGVPLEENKTLTRRQRIELLQEELIDGLKYCEHLKAIDDDGITANDYQRAAMRTAGDDKENYLLNGVMGLCGESGEVIDLVKKHLHQGHELDKKQLALECGDCAWYLALIASAIDTPFGEVLQMNIEKLKERYPEGFSKERSIHREEYDG